MENLQEHMRVKMIEIINNIKPDIYAENKEKIFKENEDMKTKNDELILEINELKEELTEKSREILKLEQNN